MTSEHEVSGIDVMIVDWHGNLRGKTLPVESKNNIMANQSRLPVSTQIQDIWSNDNDDVTQLALTVGDPDGVCVVEPRTFSTQPWAPKTAQILSSMYTLDGRAHFADSREILKRLLDQFTQLGLTPVVAVEMEFYLLDVEAYEKGTAKPPSQSLAGNDPNGTMQLYDFRASDRMHSVLTRILDYAKAQNLPVETKLAEFGPGQYEINLLHRSDALQAADEAVLFKRCVDCAARDAGLAATFMAKPYTEYSGSGLHVHVSVLNEQGENVFNEPSDTPITLLQATAGLLNTMQCMQLVFAPNANSYKRMQPESFSPMYVNWGYDHRGVAVRLPAISGSAARLEHRVSGADANPYLALTAILGGVLQGLNAKQQPGMPPLLPNEVVTQETPVLTHDWISAIDAWAGSDVVGDIFGQQFQQLYAAIKRLEAKKMNAQVSNIDLQTYLTRL